MDEEECDEMISKVAAALQEQGYLFTEEEKATLRAVALFIISMRTAGVVIHSVGRFLLWSGWIVLLLLAWKNGTLLSSLTNWHP